MDDDQQDSGSGYFPDYCAELLGPAAPPPATAPPPPPPTPPPRRDGRGEGGHDEGQHDDGGGGGGDDGAAALLPVLPGTPPVPPPDAPPPPPPPTPPPPASSPPPPPQPSQPVQQPQADRIPQQQQQPSLQQQQPQQHQQQPQRRPQPQPQPEQQQRWQRHVSDDALLEPFHYINRVPGKDVRGILIDCFQLWFRVGEESGGDEGGGDGGDEGEGDGGAGGAGAGAAVVDEGAAKDANVKAAAATTTTTTTTTTEDTAAAAAAAAAATDTTTANGANRASQKGVLDAIKSIVGSLHHASLLIDDIEDNSKLRRGVPVAHAIFGVPATINCANYAYFLAMEECYALNNPRAIRIFLTELLNLHRGQGYDILWREQIRCPTEEEYVRMVVDKTGGLFRLAVGLMQSFATRNRDRDFTPLVNRLALYFQIRDDYINLADEEYYKSKSFCEDLTEGKFSFPILHCIRSDPNDTTLLNILKQRTTDVDVKRYAQSLMKRSGSLRYTRRKCREVKRLIVRDIQSFGGNPPLLRLLEKLDVQLSQMDDDDDDEEENSQGQEEGGATAASTTTNDDAGAASATATAATPDPDPQTPARGAPSSSAQRRGGTATSPPVASPPKGGSHVRRGFSFDQS